MSSVEGGIIQRKEVNKYCIVYIRKYKHTVGIFRRAKVSCFFLVIDWISFVLIPFFGTDKPRQFCLKKNVRPLFVPARYRTRKKHTKLLAGRNIPTIR